MEHKYNPNMYYLLQSANYLYGGKNEFKFQVYCDFFFKEYDCKRSADSRYGAFIGTCRRLCEIGGYTSIFSFVVSVLNSHEKYDIPALGEALACVEIRDDYTLRDLCSDFYKDTISNELFSSYESDEVTKEFLAAENIFAPDVKLPKYKNQYCRIHMESALGVICRKLYGINDIDPMNITKEDVDRLALAVIEADEEKQRNHINYLMEVRRKQEEHDKKYGNNGLGREVIPKLSKSDCEEKLPGILSLVFTLLEVIGKDELCFYILSRYVFPFFTEYDWTTGDAKADCYALIVKIYSDVLQSLLFHNGSPICDRTISNEEKMYKIIMEEPEEAAVEYALNVKDAMTMWAEILHKGARRIKPAMGDGFFSFHIAATAYLLVLAKVNQTASQLLIDHYRDVKPDNISFYCSIIALIRSTLQSDDINTVNRLYGYFCEGEATYQRDRCFARDLIREAYTFFREAEAYIKENDQLDYITRRKVYDILYTDDRVRGIEKELIRCEETDSVPDAALCSKMSNALIGFKERIGVDLGRFANRNNPEEVCLTLDTPLQFIGGGLSRNLRNTAERLYGEIGTFALLRKMKAIEDLRFGCDLLIQNKLIEMRKKTILESADKFASIRDMELDSDAITEMIIKETEKLASVLRPDDYDRIVTEKLINESHRRFCNTFYPNGERNLLAELPVHIRTELWGYFVTAEMVYRYLGEQNCSDLDYTPALISLTKALEFVLFEAYKRMDVTDITGVDGKVLSKCLWENNNTNTYQGKTSQLELGSLIYLLKDGSKIFLEKAHGTVSYRNTRYRTSHFSKWNNGVLNISELRKFAGVDIIGADFPDKNRAYTLHFSAANNSEDNNRAILAYALDYIKQNYRNPAAHKDRMEQTAVEACRELMLSTEQMLWILISVIDFSKPEI